MVSEAIAGGNIQAINYFVANNYVKALEALATAPNQKVLMLPLEATSLMGSLAGVAEIAREAFGGGSSDHGGSSDQGGGSKKKGSVPPVPHQPKT